MVFAKCTTMVFTKINVLPWFSLNVLPWFSLNVLPWFLSNVLPWFCSWIWYLLFQGEMYTMMSRGKDPPQADFFVIPRFGNAFLCKESRCF